MHTISMPATAQKIYIMYFLGQKGRKREKQKGRNKDREKEERKEKRRKKAEEEESSERGRMGQGH